MKKTLLPHQKVTSDFLAARKFAGDFSGMGSGKTLSAIAAVEKVRGSSGSGVALIGIGPPISLSMWKREYEAFTSRPAQILLTGKAAIDKDADAILMSYQIAVRRIEELKALKAIAAFADEGHALKTHDSARTEAILGPDGLWEYVDYFWDLTGTPSTRYNDDLFVFLCRACPDRLRSALGGSLSLDRFRLRYCRTEMKRFAHMRNPVQMTTGNRNTEELNKMLFEGDDAPAIRHDLKSVWAEMPEMTVQSLTVQMEMTPELKRMLSGLSYLTMQQVKMQMAAKDPALATMRRHIGLAKVKHTAKEIISRIDAGAGPILVGGWHTEVLAKLREAVRKGKVSAEVIDGKVSAKRRDAYIAAFNAGKLDVLIGQIGAMGVSIDLQGECHKIVVIEEDWSPAIMDQFYARVMRRGQRNRVIVDVFAADTKLDRAVGTVNGRKDEGHKTLLKQKEQ